MLYLTYPLFKSTILAMDVFKAMARVGNDAVITDAIYYKNAWWLVLAWTDDPSTGQEVPARLVQMSSLVYQEVQGLPYRFVVNTEFPKAVFDGEQTTGFVVEDYLAQL